MAKDKKINEIPGISAAAIVQLTRMGIVGVQDLLHADFDRVAYVLEDYKEATRLVNEANKMVSKRGAKQPVVKPADASGVEHVVALKPVMATEPETPAKNETTIPAAHRPRPAKSAEVRADGKTSEDTTVARAPSASGAKRAGATVTGAESPLALALSMLGRGVSLADRTDADSRLALARRLAVADLLLRYGGSELELIAALLTEPIELGTVSPQEALSRFGGDVWRVVEQVMTLRSVPLMPTGKPPAYYLEMARTASRESRRVCAAFLTQSLSIGVSGTANLFHARLLVEALRGGGPDDLVDLAAASLEHAATEGVMRAAA
jgi:hypothetical protein